MLGLGEKINIFLKSKTKKLNYSAVAFYKEKTNSQHCNLLMV